MHSRAGAARHQRRRARIGFERLVELTQTLQALAESKERRAARRRDARRARKRNNRPRRLPLRMLVFSEVVPRFQVLWCGAQCAAKGPSSEAARERRERLVR